MPCYKPGRGRQAPNGTITYYGHLQIAAGKVPPLPSNYQDFPLPCGKCAGCKLELARQWAVRLVHEKQMHQKASWLTLTMSDDYLLQTRAHVTRARGKIIAASLDKKELQLFTKRLNEDVRRRSSKGVKYFACGEYGEHTHRPHYHIAVYGEDFSDDRYFYQHSKSGNPLWRSSRLDRLWPHGNADIGELTFETAAYTAAYTLKKITGTKALEAYKRTDEEGNEYWLLPEFSVMSRRPGIASVWFQQFKDDVYPHDHVISRGHPAKPPRYYDKLLEKIDPYLLQEIKADRKAAAQQTTGDNTPARLEARETVALAKLNQNKRSLE